MSRSMSGTSVLHIDQAAASAGVRAGEASGMSPVDAQAASSNAVASATGAAQAHAQPPVRVNARSS